MRKKITVYLLVFILMLLSLSCGEKITPGTTEAGKGKKVKARIGVAELHTQPFFYEAVGNVEARTTSTIASKLMGTVKNVHVQESDQVKQGDILIEIDDRQVTAQLRKAEAALAEANRALISARSSRDSAKAGAELATATYKRYQELLKKQTVSRQEFEEIEAKYRQANAALAQAEAMVEASSNRVEQAEASVESARVSKKDALVKAPYDGTITAKMISVGDLASPGTPFFALEKEGAFCVSLVIPEENYQTVKLGEKVNVVIPSLKDKIVEGTVGRIDPAADLRSRSFQVKVALPDDDAFRSGTFARVVMPMGEAGMILIPEIALVRRGQLTGYYLVDDENIAHFRLVRLGQKFADKYEVVSGLHDGDRYVIEPVKEIQDGTVVEVNS